MYVYLYNYAEIDLKFDSADATWLIGMIGILNTVGEVLVGWLGMNNIRVTFKIKELS